MNESILDLSIHLLMVGLAIIIVVGWISKKGSNKVMLVLKTIFAYCLGLAQLYKDNIAFAIGLFVVGTIWLFVTILPDKNVTQ